jgi:uncharacterized protein
MHKTVLLLLFGCSIASLPAGAADPSFDCGRATHEVEKLICKDAELARLDNTLDGLYAAVLESTPASQQRMLKAEQRGWVKGRNDCWKSSDMRGCVADEYRGRIAELKDY